MTRARKSLRTFAQGCTYKNTQNDTHTNANIQPNLYDIDNFENYQFPTFSRYTISCEVNAWGLPLNRRHAIVWTNDGFTFHTFIYVTRPPWVNPLAPGRFEWKFRQVIFKLISVINGWGIFCEMIRRRIWLDLTDDKLTLIQVINWANVDQVLCRHIASLGLHNLMLGSVRCRIMASHKHAWLWSLTDCCQEVLRACKLVPPSSGWLPHITSGAHYRGDLSIVIQIRWKLVFVSPHCREIYRCKLCTCYHSTALFCNSPWGPSQ